MAKRTTGKSTRRPVKKSMKNRARYRIKPLAFVLFAAILLIIVACVVLFAGRPFEVGGGGFLSPTATASPTPEPTPTPVPTPSPSPSPTPMPTPRSATIRSLGEIAIQDNLLKAALQEDGSYDFSEMFSLVSDVMGDADFTVADVEGSLGGTVNFSGGAQLLTPPSLIETLRDCGVDMLNFANDHALDGGFADLQAAIENCKAAGMEYVGAAASKEERVTPKIIEINGIRVGFVGYTETLNGMEKKTDANAVNYGVNLATKSNPTAEVKACREAGAEIVVAYVSWGETLNRQTTKNQQTMAKQLVQSGVDVIIGYNPHVIQPAMWLELTNNGKVSKRTLCMLSNGNFLSDSRSQYSDSGVIFQFTLQEREDLSGIDIVNPQYIPTYVWRIEDENSAYDYRTLAAGQWLETAPEGMSYTQESRMRAVWAEAQSIMGADVAKVANQ